MENMNCGTMNQKDLQIYHSRPPRFSNIKFIRNFLVASSRNNNIMFIICRHGLIDANLKYHEIILNYTRGEYELIVLDINEELVIPQKFRQYIYYMGSKILSKDENQYKLKLLTQFTISDLIQKIRSHHASELKELEEVIPHKIKMINNNQLYDIFTYDHKSTIMIKGHKFVTRLLDGPRCSDCMTYLEYINDNLLIKSKTGFKHKKSERWNIVIDRYFNQNICTHIDVSDYNNDLLLYEYCTCDDYL
jgi:hypothetical protein